MLVLSRKINEKIMVGDNIEIQVVEIRRDKISLGITAPKSTPVYREEVLKNIQNENHKKEKKNAKENK